jgi:predicted ester cyclase
MLSITSVARQFLEACESGKGWAVCRQWCTADATFAAQAEPLADVRTLQQYTDWMTALLGFIPDGRYELKSFAVDEERRNICAYAVFTGTHSGTGGPCAPTGRSVASDYVYVMFFDVDKIRHMQKIWHAGLAMQQLGWV